MSGNSSDPSGRATWVKGLLKGWKARFPKKTKRVRLLGKDVSTDSVQTLLEKQAARFKLVEDARLALSIAVKQRDEAFAHDLPMLEALEALVRAMHGHSEKELADYGLTPPRKTRLTPEQVVLSTARRLETREVRGVRGRRQQQRITVTAAPVVKVLGPDGKPLGGLKAPATPPRPQRRLPAPPPKDDDLPEE